MGKFLNNLNPKDLSGHLIFCIFFFKILLNKEYNYEWPRSKIYKLINLRIIQI